MDTLGELRISEVLGILDSGKFDEDAFLRCLETAWYEGECRCELVRV
jgi:hypothetical protein